MHPLLALAHHEQPKEAFALVYCIVSIFVSTLTWLCSLYAHANVANSIEMQSTDKAGRLACVACCLLACTLS
eukprot:1888192-Amphidinium_carterae.1